MCKNNLLLTFCINESRKQSSIVLHRYEYYIGIGADICPLQICRYWLTEIDINLVPSTMAGNEYMTQ